VPAAESSAYQGSVITSVQESCTGTDACGDVPTFVNVAYIDLSEVGPANNAIQFSINTQDLPELDGSANEVTYTIQVTVEVLFDSGGTKRSIFDYQLSSRQVAYSNSTTNAQGSFVIAPQSTQSAITTSPSSTSSGLSTATIIGLSFGIAGLLVLIVAVVIGLQIWNKNKAAVEAPETSSKSTII